MHFLPEVSPGSHDQISLEPPLPRPLFRNPKRYLECRQRPGLLGRLKVRSEIRALEKCLRSMEAINSVCDVPCGPGRLFRFWSQHVNRVVGFDLAEEMVCAAFEAHEDLGLGGGVELADAFDLASHLSDRVDLIACVRFAYYFDRPARIALWRSLGNVTNRYVLLQFKVSGTLRSCIHSARKGLLRRGRKRTRRHPRHIVTRQEIAQEVSMAGLRLVKFIRAGQFSYSAYALAERLNLSPSNDLSGVA